MKKISVIMAVYNVEKYIEASINSVLNQTYTDFELIIVDDGSTDNSSNIAERYAKKDKRIKVIHKTNGGLSDARNAGIPYISGDYTLFIDSDDYWEENLLESIVEYNANNSLDVIIFGYMSDFYSRDGSVTRSEKNTEHSKIIDKKVADNIVIDNKHLLGYAWNKAYKSTLITKYHIAFEKGVSYVEDILFNAHIFQQAKKVGILDKPLYHYAQRPAETLGRKYYDNMGELDILANQAFCKVLDELSVSTDDIAAFSSHNLFIKARWSIGIIANTDKIDRKTKIDKINNILNYLNDNINSSLLPRDTKSSMYIFLFKHSMSGTILAIENTKNKNVKRFLRDITPSKLKNSILYFTSKSNRYDYLQKDTRKIIVTLAADYGNLGDVAITYAQHKFLKDNFNDYEVIELPISRTYHDLRSLKKKMSRHDIVTIVGGGNMGDLYKDIEDQRKFIINKFPKNRIVSFPQTIDFSSTSDGLAFLKESQKTYNKHHSLTLLAREEKSYTAMTKIFRNDVYLMPDIVLSLDEADQRTIRGNSRVTLCIRKDKESSLNETEKQKLLDYLKSKEMDVYYQDTHIGDVTLSSDEGETALREIWGSFKSSGLVITDRLHGMIFCAITKTPCIAINNSNGKVAGVYKKWLKNANYINLVSDFDIDTIIEKIENLKEINPESIKALDYTKEFRQLKKVITNNRIDK